MKALIISRNNRTNEFTTDDKSLEAVLDIAAEMTMVTAKLACELSKMNVKETLSTVAPLLESMEMHIKAAFKNPEAFCECAKDLGILEYTDVSETNTSTSKLN